MSTGIGESIAIFPSTHWPILPPLQDDRLAIEDIVRRYTPALRGYLVYRRRLDFDTANEVIQGFLLDKILTGKLLEQADQQRGRFRNLLRKSIDNYLISWMRKQRVRRSGSSVVSFDVLEDRQGCNQPADRFEYLWARQVIGAALWRMRRRCRQEGTPELWGLLAQRLIRPILHGKAKLSYSELQTCFGFRSYGQATKAMTRAKALYLECLRETVRVYIPDEAMVEDEICDLKVFLARRGGSTGPVRTRI